MTYSFLDTSVVLSGPGTDGISLGAGAAVAEEGITIEFSEDKDVMRGGADTAVVHSLIANRMGVIIVRLLKTSPTNQLLQALYDFQTSSSLLHGQNVMTVNNPILGDMYSCNKVAFAKFPANSYAKEAGMIEWRFNASYIHAELGSLIDTL
jgi:hypothetical protein